MGETVKALEEMQLLSRNGIEENKRVLVLQLTAKGQRLITRADKLVTPAEAQLLAALSSAEREHLTAAIVKIRNAANVR